MKLQKIIRSILLQIKITEIVVTAGNSVYQIKKKEIHTMKRKKNNRVGGRVGGRIDIDHKIDQDVHSI